MDALTEEREEKEQKKKNKMGLVGATIKAAIGDAVLTFMWVFSASTLGPMTSVIATYVGVKGMMLPSLFITTVLISVLVFIIRLIGNALGGASFNPTGTVSFYAAGVVPHSLFTMAVRFPAQAAGAVGGALAIMKVMPTQYKHMLGGPRLKVDVHTGAIAEGVLTFIVSFAVLFIFLKGPRNMLVKIWLGSMSRVTMVVVGSSFTGPAMNPANAFGWAYVNNQHNTWDQFYVYWICPFTGAILAGWVFRALFPLPEKQKKA